MKVYFYFHVLCQVVNVLASTNSNNKGSLESCVQNVEHMETSFIKDLCKSNPDLEEFMIAADILIRSDCALIDSCRRVVEQPHDDHDEVDFIVVGGGVAGPVVAGRLTENPNWTVTLLESGPEQPAATDIPALLSSAIATKYDWQYSTTPQKNACLAYGGVCGWPRGKVLGGTAVLSGSMYSRGHRDVYDGWLRDGNVGWGYDDVLPFFKMSENNKDYHTEHHGNRGPISVQKPTEILPITRTLMEAAQELGYEEIDMSDPEPMGFSIAQLMMSSAKTRVTTPTAYLRPHLRTRSNLRVRTNSHVTRLLVAADRRSVYGVEYVDGSNRTRRLTARKEVILCAGVIGSAHLLMLSGIGPAEDLRPLGVPVVQDLRVGHNLQHHVASKLTFQLNVTNDRLLSFDTIGQYMKHRSGPLSTTGGLQTSAFLRSNRAGPAEPADVQLFFDGYSPNCAYALPVFGGQCFAATAPVVMNVRPVNIRRAEPGAPPVGERRPVRPAAHRSQLPGRRGGRGRAGVGTAAGQRPGDAHQGAAEAGRHRRPEARRSVQPARVRNRPLLEVSDPVPHSRREPSRGHVQDGPGLRPDRRRRPRAARAPSPRRPRGRLVRVPDPAQLQSHRARHHGGREGRAFYQEHVALTRDSKRRYF
ncbi:hypothetical protein AGLY_001362 [Aphis glycines]|uniref:Glucose-methanol-choline oxidoreductase N-terminal domain-containing protein n=1 Tax=Aphis glycines TaxID=307491 RepID=A0A6G0U5G4_APHGL|nr:hypothetical protein AGLY_001362 [Aphis glycines]